MDRWVNKVAVVTGASSGIGVAVVKDLIAADMIVVGLARRVERVEAIRADLPKEKQKNLHALKCDVTNLEDVNKSFDWIQATLGSIDVLVNNAGCLKAGWLCDMDESLVQEVLQTNIMGVVRCTQRAFKCMKERKFAGHVILINSIAGHTPFAGFPNAPPNANIYSATKFAITCMNEIYRKEFMCLETKIKITNMARWAGKTAVVTGASSGIGVAVCKDLIKNGMVVVALARRLERIEAIKNDLPEDKCENFHPMKCDVTNVKSVNKTFDCIKENLCSIDVLVNNAGILKPGFLIDMDEKLVNDVIQTNLMGVVRCTQRAYKCMAERKFPGHIILISSIAGQAPFAGFPGSTPNANIYSPTKFAVTCMTEIYRQEFMNKKSKIKITSICPGIVDTEIVPDEVKKNVGKALLRPEDISSGILYAISTPPHCEIYEMTIKPLGETIR